ncbi:MAG TPA: CHAT domain-containing protein, partial [Pyrinomonadaceae bacterium]|nr:CHAT domain-containing protein [Pyrinomonadaceae bacterium]
AAGRSGAREAARERTSQFVNRLNIERGESGFQYTALTDSAVIPVRRIEVQSFFTDGIAKQLARSDGEEQYEYGRLLHTYVFPEEFERFVAAKPYRPLTLVLDSTTASLPWEMACFDAPGERVNFGIHLMLSRQFRTTLAAAPGVAPPVNKSLRVLVIADPASDDADIKLEAARDEGWAVFDLFERLREERKEHIDIKVEKYIGAGECDPLRMLRLLFNNAYDIVHFSGHGLFDPRRPNRSGWVFGRNCVLSAREIFRARQVPRLVFANACFSSATKATSARAAARRQQQTTQKLAGMAEAFFVRGVQNYIGAGWDVQSAASVKFSTEFYARAVGGTRLCEALAAARLSIFDTEDTNYRASWGAYQHYGQANTRLVP